MQIKNIKFNWKMIFIIGLIITLISGCEVKAVNIVNSVPSSNVSQVITVDQFNNIIYELYGLDIDISDYENLRDLNLSNKSWFRGLFQVKRRSDGKLFPAVGAFGLKQAQFHCDINGNYSGKYYFEMQYCYVINTEKNSIERVVVGFGDIMDTSTKYTYLEEDLDYMMYELASKFEITLEEFISQEYQSILFYNFFDWFNGKFYKNNVGWNNGGPTNSESSIEINQQIHWKRNYFKYSDGDYISGDLTLYDDYLEIKGLETSYPNLNLYVLRFPVVYNSYDNYQISGPIEWQSISSINITKDSQTWEIGNPFPLDSGENDYIYAFGIKKEGEISFGIFSEYFSEKGELQSDIINSIPFRNKYYVQIFDQFFIPREFSGGDNGGLGNITNPSGDVTGNINLGDIVSSGDTMAGNITLEDITSKIDFNIIDNPYTELWDTIINGFEEALTSRNPKSISFNIRETKIIINSDDIMLPQNEIKVFISLFTNTAMLMAIFIQIQKIIIKAQEGDISSLLSVADEDIHFYDDMQMM